MVAIIIAITLCFLLMFFMTRLLMAMYLCTLIKKRKHRADRTKGQSFWEWLTYKRFSDILPKGELAYLAYWGNFILYIILIALSVVLHFCNMLDQCREVLCSVQFILIGGVIGIRFVSLGGYRKNK